MVPPGEQNTAAADTGQRVARGGAGRRETHGTVLGVLDAAAALVPAESGPALVLLNVGVAARCPAPPPRTPH